MNVYEFLSTHRSVLEAILSLPAKPSDVKYIELYKDYVKAFGNCKIILGGWARAHPFLFSPKID